MAFGNISTIYFPIAASAGTSQWGTDVRKLLDSADGTSDSTTITNHGTGGAVTRTEDPYTTSAADSDQTLFGWAINPTDMNSVSGALRFYPAGDHISTIRMGSNSALAVNGTLFMYVYRVASAAGGRTRTLLGSNSATVAFPALSGQVTASVTVALDEIIFEEDETIQYSYELQLAGVAITGRTATFFTGTTTSVASRVDTPILKVLADTTGTSAGVGSASGVTGKVLGANGTSAGVATASGVMSTRSDFTGSSAGVATVTGQMSSVAGFVGSASGVATVSGLTSKVLGTTGTVNIGSGEAPPAEIVNPDYVLTTDGQLEKFVADTSPYPLYLKL